MVQWLTLTVSNAGDAGSIPGQETKVPHAAWYGPPKIKKNQHVNNTILSRWPSWSCAVGMNPRAAQGILLSPRMLGSTWKGRSGRQDPCSSGQAQSGLPAWPCPGWVVPTGGWGSAYETLRCVPPGTGTRTGPAPGVGYPAQRALLPLTSLRHWKGA